MCKRTPPREELVGKRLASSRATTCKANTHKLTQPARKLNQPARSRPWCFIQTNKRANWDNWQRAPPTNTTLSAMLCCIVLCVPGCMHACVRAVCLCIYPHPCVYILTIHYTHKSECRLGRRMMPGCIKSTSRELQIQNLHGLSLMVCWR